MALEFDPAKSRENFRKHGVSFAQAEAVLSDPLALTMEDPDASGESRLVTLGSDAAGFLLVVVWTMRSGRIRVISARRATGSERKRYAA